MAQANDFEALLTETRRFEPSAAFTAQANTKDPSVHEQAARNPEGFWAEMAAQLDWFTPWERVLEWESPQAKWFTGGKLNVSYNCIDRHTKSWRRNKAAIWEGEPGDERVLTYQDLYREVNQFANVLKNLGVKRGDRVTLYMPMIPELAIAMLACTRIGAPHSVVFGGFSAEARRSRIQDAESKVVITADGGFRRGAAFPLKKNVDVAVAGTAVESVVVVRPYRGGRAGHHAGGAGLLVARADVQGRPPL